MEKRTSISLKPPTMSQEERFLFEEAHQSLDGAGIYSDWLEEQGRVDDAHCWRWMYYKKKEPVKRIKYGNGRQVPERWSWAWFCESQTWDSALEKVPHHAQLSPIFMPITYRSYIYFDCRHTAVESLRLCLLRVIRQLKPEPELTLLEGPVIFSGSLEDNPEESKDFYNR